MKKLLSLCATAMFLSSATVCCAQAPAAAPAKPAAAPPAAAAPAKPAAPAAPAAPARADKVGMAALPWKATVVAGESKTISSDDLKGKAYAIVFVNSSCADCRREMEELMNMKFGDKISVIVGAVDRKMERALGVYKDEMKVPYPIIEDNKFIVAQSFGIAFTPATVIVGSDGKVEYLVAGYTEETMKATNAAFAKYLK